MHQKGGEKIQHRTFRFSIAVIKLLDSVDKKQYSNTVMVRQLMRSATSIGANVMEAQAGSKGTSRLTCYSWICDDQ